MSISVKTDNLTRRFGNFMAVDNVSIEVSQGEIFGFLGANGAGKTTMIRMLCGLLAPSGGSGTVAGYDIAASPEAIKKNIGYMSQKFSLYEDLTVSENIEFFGGIYGQDAGQIKKNKERLLDQVGLEGQEGKITKDLPLGFKQRLALGCALLHDPPIVFLDEPTSGVDPKARRSFWDLIQTTVAGGKTVFVTTHFMEEAEYCHTISVMQQGRLVAWDTPGNLKKKLNKNSIQEVFVSLLSESEASS